MTATDSMAIRASVRRHQLNDMIVNDPSTDTHKPPSQIFLSAAIAELKGGADHPPSYAASPPTGGLFVRFHPTIFVAAEPVSIGGYHGQTTFRTTRRFVRPCQEC